MSLLPAYMGDAWKCYETMSREDRALIDPALVNASPELCHVSLLPFLAWEVDVDISGLSEAISRKAIRAAFDAMKYAGTARALIGPVEALSRAARVSEWPEYSGAPYHFRVDVEVTDHGVDEAMILRLEKTALKQKNARSILDAVTVNLTSTCTMSMAALTHVGELAILYPYQLTLIEFNHVKQYGAAMMQSAETFKIYPQGA